MGFGSGAGHGLVEVIERNIRESATNMRVQTLGLNICPTPRYTNVSDFPQLNSVPMIMLETSDLYTQSLDFREFSDLFFCWQIRI